jgi:alanyl-tRNA synthetase
MRQAELLSNKIVWKNQPVITQIVHPDELPNVPLRKPPAVTSEVRVVQVADFDWSACGGTHVDHTGEVGIIKIIKWERRGTETRVEFRCGRRALDDYGRKSDMVQHVAAGFNVGHWELDQAVERLKAEVKDTRSRLRQAERTLSRYEAAEWRATAPNVAGVRLVVRNLAGRSSADMRALAQQLVSEPGVVALLGLAVGTPSSDGNDQKAQFCFARSSDVQVDMASLVRDTAETLGARRGGGKPDFAQGGGPLTHKEQMDDVLDWAAQKLGQQLTESRVE